jgi:Uma2 family endonuclease
MGSIDVISRPLTQQELTDRYQQLVDDPGNRQVQGSLELNAWGQIIMTPPADFWHYRVAARLVRMLVASLGGESLQEGPIAIEGHGTFVADVVWCSPRFLAEHARERVLQRAPELCIEVLSSSNSTKEIEEKRRAYLAAGAIEVWVVDPEAGTIELTGADGPRQASSLAVELTGLFAP